MARKIGRVRSRTISEVGTGGDGRVHRAGGHYCPACASIHNNHNNQYSTSNADPVATAITSTTDTDTATTAIGSTANTLDSDDDAPVDMGRSDQNPAGCSDLNEDLPIGNSDLSWYSADRLAVQVLNSAIQNLNLDNSQTSGLRNSLNLTTTLNANLPGYLRTNGTDDSPRTTNVPGRLGYLRTNGIDASPRTTNISGRLGYLRTNGSHNSLQTTNINGRLNINLRYTNHLATVRASRNAVAAENSINRPLTDATIEDGLHSLTSVTDVGLDVMVNVLYNRPK